MLAVAKPAGPTSHDVVDVVRRVLGTSRIGHLGTLDPFAEGLLVMVVGRATRLAVFTKDWRKTYEGVIHLGTTTTTDDRTGAPERVSESWREIDRAAVEAAFGGLRGARWQRPPAHSAVKVDGERAYRRARRGETVTLAERPVEIVELALLEWAPPAVRFRATVSGGTYVRSLARDVGAALGCGGHLSALTRTGVGPYRLTEAKSPEAVTVADLRPAAELVQGMARRHVDAAERDAVTHGRPLPATSGADQVALFAGDELVAVAERQGEVVKPRVVVAE